MQSYVPVAVHETEAAMRRADTRIIAAAGYPLPRRRPVRQRIGAVLIALGAALLGPASTLAPDPEPAVSGP